MLGLLSYLRGRGPSNVQCPGWSLQPQPRWGSFFHWVFFQFGHVAKLARAARICMFLLESSLTFLNDVASMAYRIPPSTSLVSHTVFSRLNATAFIQFSQGQSLFQTDLFLANNSMVRVLKEHWSILTLKEKTLLSMKANFQSFFKLNYSTGVYCSCVLIKFLWALND